MQLKHFWNNDIGTIIVTAVIFAWVFTWVMPKVLSLIALP